MTLESHGLHEIAKATAAITLASKLLQKLNAEPSAEWEPIKAGIGT